MSQEGERQVLVHAFEYLGHNTDADRLQTLKNKVKVITKALIPCNTQELRSFLGY